MLKKSLQGTKVEAKSIGRFMIKKNVFYALFV